MKFRLKGLGITLLVIFTLTVPMLAVHATPDGAELLAACKHSLEEGFSDIEGMMCTWYVTPCDCDYDKNNDIPRVCLPASTDIDALAREVITGLIAQPELQELNADIAANTILIRNYPCDN